MRGAVHRAGIPAHDRVAAVARRVRETFGVDRGRQTTVGGRLSRLAEAAGLVPLAEKTATQVWSSWDPDQSPRHDGWAPMGVMAEAMVEAGQLRADEVDRFVETVEEAARHGCFTLRLTMHLVVASAPTGGERQGCRCGVANRLPAKMCTAALLMQSGS